jgi:uncharacterized membrane protein
MNRLSPEPLIIAAAAAVAAEAAMAPTLNPVIRMLLALPLVAFLPGYAVIRAAAPATRPGLVDCVVLSLGTSLSMAALGGVLLFLTPPGIHADTWVALLLSVTLVAALVLRISDPRRNEPWRINSWLPAVRARLYIDRVRALQGVFFGLAFAIVVAAFLVAIAGVESQPRPGFAQLWLTNTDDPGAVRIGIRNEEHRPINVLLRLTHGSSVEAVWPSITLGDGESWETTATVSDFAGGTLPLQATLTRVETPETVYRYVTLWPS